jgi:hypothetical protein
VGFTLFYIILWCMPCFPKTPEDDEDTSDLRTNMVVCLVCTFLILPVSLALSPLWIFVGSWLNRLQRRAALRVAEALCSGKRGNGGEEGGGNSPPWHACVPLSREVLRLLVSWLRTTPGHR